MEKINKIKGALYGAIIGDALGAPLEFMPQEKSNLNSARLQK